MRNLKKITILFVIIIGFILAKSSISLATDTVVASGDCGTSITWTLYDSGVLTISGSGNMTNGSASAWADYQEQVKSVVFDGEITSIGSRSFKENNNIETITLPSTVQTIGEYAFYNCTNLKEINIPSSLYRINNYAFYGCSSLENIDLGSNIMYINEADTTISNSATIYGYNYSNAFYYARYNGRKFHDIATGKKQQKQLL